MIRAVVLGLITATLAGATQAQVALETGQARNGVMPAAGPGATTCYTLRTYSTAPIEAIVRSDAFDPMVEIAPGSDCLARDGWSDDDGGAASGGPLDARLVTAPQPAGDYVVRVRRADGRSGPFQVMAMSGSTRVAGSTALNSPTLAGTREREADVRAQARSAVTAGYAPPPRPAGYEALSDGDLLETLVAQVGDGPDMVARAQAMDPVARAWMRYHTRWVTSEYLAGSTAWRDANPTSAQVDRQRAAETQARAHAQASVQQASASRLTTYEQQTFAAAMTDLADIPDDGDGIRYSGMLFRATQNCANITPFLARMSPDERARANAECPWDAINRMNAQGVGTGYQAAQGAGNPISPLAPRDPGPGTGNVNVRTYDARTGTYSGTTVMTPLEAELRGARPQ